MSVLFVVVIVACQCVTHGFVDYSFSDQETDSETPDVASGSGSLEDNKIHTMDRTRTKDDKAIGESRHITIHSLKWRQYVKSQMILSDGHGNPGRGRASSIARSRPSLPHLTEESPTPCSTRNITLKTDQIVWKSLLIKVKDRYHRILQVLPPHRTFDLTICSGTCSGEHVQSKANFRGLQSRILARVKAEAANSLRIRPTRCCVPVTTAMSPEKIKMNFIDKQGIRYKGEVEGLKNAVKCACM